MEKVNSKKWYNRVWLVILPCLILFPLNFIILWKNQTIKIFWKVLLLIVSPLFTLATIGVLAFSYKNTSSFVRTTFRTNLEESAKKINTDEPVVFYDWNTALAGYKNSEEEIIIPVQFDYADTFENGVAIVCQNGKYGYIDKSGNPLLPIQFEQANKFVEGVTIVKKENKWQLINTKGVIIKTLEYDEIWQTDTLYYAKKDGLYGHLNYKGVETIPPILAMPLTFHDGLAYGGSGKGKIIYVNSQLKPVLSIEATRGDEFSDGLAAVVINGKVGFIDTEGRLVIAPEYEPFKYFLPSFYLGIACVQKNGKYGFINKKGEVIIPFDYDYASSFLHDGLTTIKINNKEGAIDSQGNMIIQPIYENLGSNFSDGVIAAKLNGKYGFVDKAGNVIVPFFFEMVYEYNGGAPFGQKNGKWALLNREGIPVTSFKFEKVYGDFSEGLACVKLNGKYGYISKSGKVIIDYIFDSGNNFSHGLVSRYKDGMKQVYDKKGREINLR